MAGFDSQMNQQRDRARNAGDFDSKKSNVVIEDSTEFLGYEHSENTAIVKAIIKESQSINELNQGEQAILILDKSSFYGESGGQCGDHGILSNKNCLFNVTDTQKQASNAYEHYGTLDSGSIKLGDKVDVAIDTNRRKKIMRNHSATHLLHEALRQVLGDQVKQKGSLVESDKLRFDFSQDEAILQPDKP